MASVYCKPEAKHHKKRNSNDKLVVRNGKIHSTHECVNSVTHTNFTALCVTEADFWSVSQCPRKQFMSWNASLSNSLK